MRSDSGVTLENYPVPQPPPTQPPAPGAAPARRSVKGSAAWYWLRERLMIGAPRLFDRLGRLGLWDPLGGDGISDELLVYRRRPPPDIQIGWRTTDAILAATQTALLPDTPAEFREGWIRVAPDRDGSGADTDAGGAS